jgi:lipopolysaccharide transport system permease protein
MGWLRREPKRGCAAGPDDGWDTIIRPEAPWLDFRLPELWRYRDLVMMFVWRDFVSQYKQTILGPLWFILQPLLTTVVFTVIFGNIAGLDTDELPKPLFYLSGQVVWGYFSGALTATSTTFVSNAGIFGKVYFPRLAVPLSIVVSQVFQFLLRVLFLLVFLAWYVWAGAPVRVTESLLLLPLLVAIMGALALGLGIIFSAMTTKYRDLRFLLTFGVQLLMYATPAILPLSGLHGRARLVMLLNPMTPVMECFRHAFTGAGTYTAAQLAYSAAFAVLSLFIGAVMFQRIERNFMDTV